MILKSIVIDGIRSHDHVEILFEEGISLFEGDIGSGKSTILMAVEFALFGVGGDLKADSLLSKSEDVGSVVLDFAVSDMEYTVKRTLKRTGAGVNHDAKNTWLKVNGEVEMLTPSDLKPRILEVLGFNEPPSTRATSRIFRYAVFTPQEEIKEVLYDPDQRRDTIRRAFEIEDYNTARLNTEDTLKNINNEMQNMEGRLEGYSDVESDITNSEKIIKDAKKNKKARKSELTALESEYKDIEARLAKARARNTRKAEISAERTAISDAIDDKNAELKRVKGRMTESESDIKEQKKKQSKLEKIKKPDTTKTLAEIEKKIISWKKCDNEMRESRTVKSTVEQDLEKLRDALGENTKSDKNKMQKRLQELENQLAKSEDAQKQKAKEIQEYNNEISKIEGETSELRSSLKKLSMLKGRCPTCEQEIDSAEHKRMTDTRKKKMGESDARAKSLRSNMDGLEDEKTKCEDEIESLSREITKLNTDIPRVQEYRAKSDILEKANLKIRKIIDLQKQEPGRGNPLEYYTGLKDSLSEYLATEKHRTEITEMINKRSDELSGIKDDITRIEAELKSKEKALAKADSELESFADVERELKNLSSEGKAQENKITEVKSAIAVFASQIESEENRITENEAKLAKCDLLRKKLELYKETEHWTEEFFIPAVVEIERQVMVSILYNFNETYSRWYSMLIEDPTKESSVDENFTPSVSQDGFDQSIDYLSGGEKTGVALAYRLTLNSLIRKETETLESNLLILDEPTDGFSRAQLGKIKDVLDELKSRQIILVSHENELEGFADHVYRVSKESGTTTVTKIE